MIGFLSMRLLVVVIVLAGLPAAADELPPLVEAVYRTETAKARTELPGIYKDAAEEKEELELLVESNTEAILADPAARQTTAGSDSHCRVHTKSMSQSTGIPER